MLGQHPLQNYQTTISALKTLPARSPGGLDPSTSCFSTMGRPVWLTVASTVRTKWNMFKSMAQLYCSQTPTLTVLPGSEAVFLAPFPEGGGLRMPCVCLWGGGARKALLLWSSNVLPKKASCRYAGNMSSNLLFFLPLRFLACSPSPSAAFASGTSRGMSGCGPTWIITDC